MDLTTPIMAQSSCPPKPALEERPLLSLEQAVDLTSIFKVLANENRLRILHALVRAGEMRVTELAKAVCMSPQAVSNQLQLLVLRGILGFRREGLNTHYRISDPCVITLLNYGLCLSEDAKERAQ
jgi:ArsR family transcriptional regulator, lead/cadmium/zinc/bismuth-responsive transcriptional repressor